MRRAFAENFERAGEVGAAVSVVVDGKTVVDLWARRVDAERSRAWERDTLVNVYSTTKGMTALCAHQLVDEGKLDLDALVARYWPELAAADKGASRYAGCSRTARACPRCETSSRATRSSTGTR